ncbi:MAG TPA: MFS transporter, partial [Alphaproteobacteria bacterium]|nr:MFS transporter [Alphaproteobacteria bacterium]
LGGFFLPLCFGLMNDYLNVWTSCFMLLFLLVAVALTWMHFAILLMEHRIHPDLKKHRFLPELGAVKNKP